MKSEFERSAKKEYKDGGGTQIQRALNVETDTFLQTKTDFTLETDDYQF